MMRRRRTPTTTTTSFPPPPPPKSTRMIAGFICHSPAATAVCMSADPVSRNPVRPVVGNDNNNAIKYSKLLESPAPPLHCETRSKNKKKPFLLLSTKNETDHHRRRHHLLLDGFGNKDLTHQKPASPDNNNVFQFQVVVMRVALHCHGCATKVKKHISKMQGVTSYSIDLEAKKVTVMGRISPLGVVESISKVKRAELWHC